MSATRPATEPGPCDVIIADFAWFSQRCGDYATRVFSPDGDGDYFRVCDEHAQKLEARR